MSNSNAVELRHMYEVEDNTLSQILELYEQMRYKLETDYDVAMDAMKSELNGR